MTAILTLLVGLVVGYVLRTRGDENQIRYARLYEKRATVLADLFEKLYRLHSNLRVWTSPLQYGGQETMKDKRITVATAYNEFADAFYSNSLWLDEQSINKAKALLEKVRLLIHEYDRVPGSGFPHSPEEEQYLRQNTDWLTEWDRIHTEATTDVGKLRDEIEVEFREILGVSDLPRRARIDVGTQVSNFVATLFATASGLLSRGKSNR